MEYGINTNTSASLLQLQAGWRDWLTADVTTLGW